MMAVSPVDPYASIAAVPMNPLAGDGIHAHSCITGTRSGSAADRTDSRRVEPRELGRAPFLPASVAEPYHADAETQHRHLLEDAHDS